MKRMLIHKKIMIFLFLITFVFACNKDKDREIQDAGNLESGFSALTDDYTVFADQWFGFYFKGKKIGYFHSISAESPAGFLSRSTGIVRMFVQPGINQQTEINEILVLGKSYELKNFEYSMNSGVNRLSLKGTVNGKKIKVSLDAGGTITEITEDVDGILFAPLSFKLKIMKEGFNTGDRFNGDIYSQPMKRITRLNSYIGDEQKIIIGGNTMKAFPVYEEIGNFKSTAWIDGGGKIIKEESYEGFEAFSESETEAKNLDKGISADQFLRLVQVSVDKKIKNPSKISSILLQFDGLSDRSVIPENEYQYIKSGQENKSAGGSKSIVVEVRKSDISKFKHLLIPVNLYYQYLKPTQFIQCNDKNIKKIADDILKKSGNDSSEFVKYSLEWLRENIKTTMTENYTALETLKSGEGECQSNAYLFAAIMRAGGVPCRIVAGIVYPERGDGFMYHAWCEVFIGKWIGVDPVFKQFPADATHVILAEGDIFSQIGIVNFINNSGVKVLNISYD